MAYGGGDIFDKWENRAAPPALGVAIVTEGAVTRPVTRRDHGAVYWSLVTGPSPSPEPSTTPGAAHWFERGVLDCPPAARSTNCSGGAELQHGT